MRISKPAGEEQLATIEACGILKEVPKKLHSKAVSGMKIKVRQYAEEEIIFSEEEVIDSIAILHSGTVRGEKFYLEGSVDLMYMYQRGEIFGAEAAVSRRKTSPLTYVANEEAVVLLADFSSIQRSDYSRQLLLALLHILADDNIKKLYKIETLSKRGLRDRIMTYLRIMGRKTGRDTFSIHMDREQFAQYLCVNRSALSYELNQMKRDGLIDFKKDKFKLL
ncbi:cyclic nucleotide-binding domain-containing protein [Anaerovorax odorimutans]|uniref:Cyclic nucleotide-binding domain-containing protein n=1 Tax=Anaerovorax odorimutans TaxID=109327 RepID=A0ABT1RNW5_9FIRM|nr:cyclic nucleotide-binding domain-containing protein [Anaerovorax odorimutans]MCQ4636882.1 cyclic nucleotide-binding domain-containing protein [Anaerovorax odorimutans]